MTFKDYYAALPKRTYTKPKTDFVERIANVCHCTPQTVRMWLTGTQLPSALARETIAKDMNTQVADLFPLSDEKN